MYETSIVFTVIYLFIVKASQEPECFRFDYEEKLLEKMVRMEFKMEQALKRIDVFEEILQRKTKDIQDTFADVGQLHDKAIEIANTSKADRVSTYIRWGRSTCPAFSNITRIYDGFAAGTHYSQSGGGVDYLCVPQVPGMARSVTTARHYSIIHGAEYEVYDGTILSSLHDHEVPCAVCLVQGTTTIMIPGRQTCYDGLSVQYQGFLMTEHDSHKSNKRFVCMDVTAEIADGSSASDQNGGRFYFVFAQCGSLKCPSYTSDCAMFCLRNAVL